jgi:polyphosphate kinase 2 (PPK2 family)
MNTFEELKEKILREYDPDLICEMFCITSEELLDRFEDRLRDPEIINKFKWLEDE